MNDIPTPNFPAPSDMKDRFRVLMEDVNMNQKDFAYLTGITAPTLSSIFNGRTSATLNHVKAMHNAFPDVSLKWLLYGEGEMRESTINTTDRGKTDAPPASSMKDTDVSLPSFFPQEDTFNVTDSFKKNATVTSTTLSGSTLELSFEQIKQLNKPPRKISEIRIFFDDGTYEIFAPKES